MVCRMPQRARTHASNIAKTAVRTRDIWSVRDMVSFGGKDVAVRQRSSRAYMWPLTPLLPEHDPAVLHHDVDLADVADRLERIAVDDDQIRAAPHRQRAELGILPEPFRAVDRRGLEDRGVRHPDAIVGVELVEQAAIVRAGEQKDALLLSERHETPHTLVALLGRGELIEADRLAHVVV